METIIRKAVLNDIPQVLSLIKELATYERASDEVEQNVESLANDAFGENPLIEIFVAEKNVVIVGISLYYIKYSTWKGRCMFLEDIIVTETERRSGLGKLLFNEVAKECLKRGYKRLEWQVLEWNEPAIKFYEKLNSRFDNEWINCKLTLQDLKKHYSL